MRANFIKIFFLFCISLSLSAQTVSTLIQDSFKNFESIHWHKDGRIISVDYNNGRVYDVSLDGSIQTLQSNIDGAVGGGFGEDGTFYYSELNTGKVYRLNEDNSSSEVASGLEQPTGILPINNGTQLLVCEYKKNRVAKIDLASGDQSIWAQGGGILGPDLVIPFANAFLISNFTNTKIFKADSSGSHNNFVQIPEPGFLGYIIERNQEVYTTSISGHKVYKVDKDKNMTVLAGTGATGYIDGDGTTATFTSPNGICISPQGDVLLVTDGNRIRMITNFGTPTGTTLDRTFRDVQLSPNPATDIVNLSVGLWDAKQVEWTIYNESGQKILQDSAKLFDAGMNNVVIPISTLRVGNYFVKVQDEEGHIQQIPFVKINK